MPEPGKPDFANVARSMILIILNQRLTRANEALPPLTLSQIKELACVILKQARNLDNTEREYMEAKMREEGGPIEEALQKLQDEGKLTHSAKDGYNLTAQGIKPAKTPGATWGSAGTLDSWEKKAKKDPSTGKPDLPN